MRHIGGEPAVRGDAPLKARVEVSFRQGVLDPEAQAIERALGSLGFAGIQGVRRAKVIELELEAATGPRPRRSSRPCASGCWPIP